VERKQVFLRTSHPYCQIQTNTEMWRDISAKLVNTDAKMQKCSPAATCVQTDSRTQRHAKLLWAFLQFLFATAPKNELHPSSWA
jgi:hypothetical protein